MEEKRKRQKPDWLKIRVPAGKEYLGIREIVNRHKLHTICTSGNCPNMYDCWARGTATLMILGDVCTRSCGFCNVKTGKPAPADPDEPERVAESVRLMGLKHCVLTSVDRDDMKDGGAGLWAATIRAVKEKNPGITIEALIPDFQGEKELIHTVIDAGPEVISHNLETVRRLTPEVRSVASYDRSLMVIRTIADAGIRAKSGIMTGLGETKEEILEAMDDLRMAGCEVFTLGQYLQPGKDHLPVASFTTPQEFEAFRKAGLEKGFTHVESHPLVRSSYKAEKHVPEKPVKS
ncbi:MAG: lipoyl synthase [Bacteroidetes bacterium]|nr:MAG: lipoyl synthase [Bacteroidota bacterium]